MPIIEKGVLSGTSMFTHKINLTSVPIGFGDRKLYDPDAEPFVVEPKFTIGNDLVFYDQNQDGKLELSELQQVYGTAFTSQDFNELRRIVRFGDAASYLDFKNRLTQKRDDKIVPLIRQKIEDDKQAIQDQFGIDLDQIFHDTTLSVEAKVIALQNSFTSVYQDQLFAAGYPEDYPILDGIVAAYLSVEFNGTSHPDLESLILAVNRKILDEFEVWGESIQDTQYAEVKYNETQQSGFLDKLEKKYKLDVQVVGHPLTESEIANLDLVLGRIQNLRPEDLKLLKTLVLIQAEFRGGGVAKPSHQINITGPFGRRSSYGNIESTEAWGPEAVNYAIESDESLRNNGTVDFLFQRLTHELGHLVCVRDRADKDNVFETPNGYPRFEYTEGFVAEWFAEDYSLFLISNGEKVMRRTISGFEVGHYEETLEYFRQKYPLAVR